MQDHLMRRHLRQAVQQQILPCLQVENSWRMVLAEPPFHVPPEVMVNFHQGKPLTIREAVRTYPSTGVTHYWPSAQVHSSRFPFMGFTLEGNTDWRIGITSGNARQLKKEFARSDYALLSLPAGSLFLMPPGTPYSSNLLPHWEHAHLSDANSKRFMMRFHALGMQCYFSRTTPKDLRTEANCYFLDGQLYFAVQALIDELHLGARSSRSAVQGLLVFIMQRALRGLENLQGGELAFGSQSVAQRDHDVSQVVDKACLYIESRFHQKLTVELIAQHVGVSPTHLFRLFRSTKQTAVMEYLTRFRLNYACTLLQDTQMSIKEIAHSTGYSSHAHFCQVFIRHFPCSSRKFREQFVQSKK
ncbi:MAG: AraC family transcriptional regulator [Abditibacteriaceae bacterium]